MKILFCSTDLVPQNRIFCYNERKIREGNEMDKKAVAVITTLVVGFLGSTFLGALLNWPDAGAICAIATMGCFVLHAIGDKKE